MARLTSTKTMTPGFEKSLFWLRTMVIYYVTRPNYRFREQFRKYAAIRTPSMAVHVRHADKHWEAELLEFSNYMSKAEEYKSHTRASNIYLMSDDSKVIKASEQYKNFLFQYLEVPRPNIAWYAETSRGAPKDILERDFLLDVYAAAQYEHQILT
ncbi:hypothetical protein BGZ96_000318 [Linnemannia gamsii]|uniref:Alpha-(1,6)-fucosyltransferase N- and catalytic domain-containing protein n=1 Tax=Linnemannia gamsii TaxID=64522 RepID=A0ABQ7JPA0_9FUNG|nr:hypothetical protein BGZ96_000318 [Linnemannia gamsii]